MFLINSFSNFAAIVDFNVHLQHIQMSADKKKTVKGSLDPTCIWRRKPQLGRNNTALLPDRHSNSKHRSMQSQDCSGQNAFQHVWRQMSHPKQSNWQQAAKRVTVS
jgi:hypothetical protein